MRRERLLNFLDEAVSTQTTLVVAPAGAGKSFLLASWFWETSTPAAWLSVDDTDRDGCQFWVVMAAAIAEVLPDLAAALGPIRRAASPAEAVRALVGQLHEEERSPLVLVVDDVHLLDGGEVAASLKLFLKSMPPWFHLVLVSRSDPDLPLDRLRARGQLAEIRFAELKFSNDEAEAMLTRLTPSLTGEQIAASVGKADGWAAGLQFSALAARSELVQGSPAPYADEADLLVADYIWHEVLATEAGDLVQVLQDTSVVKRTNASLAATLAGRPDAFDLLLAAERRGLFVNRVGRSGWVEMHVVLRDVLVNEAVGRYPERVALLHSRAARWFEEAGEVISALDHWLLSGQSREGLRLLASAVADAYDGGRGVILARMLAQIPVTVVASDIQAMLDYAWCQFLVDSKRFLETVQQAATTIERIEGPDVTTVSRLTMLQSIAAAMTGDWALGGRRAAEAAASLGDDAVRDHVGRFAWNMLARDIALSEAWEDTSEEVQEIRLALSADPERRLAFEGTRAMGESMAGRPVDALRVSAGVRAAARVNNLMVLQGELGVAEGIAHRELGDRVRAVAELVPLTESTLAPMSHARVAALLELTQLRLDEGDLDAAELTFASATELVRSDFSGAGGVAWLARTGTLVALATGDLAGAHSWSDQVDDPFWGAVSRARVCIEEGRRPEAAALLTQAQPRCIRHEVVRDLLRVRAAEPPTDCSDIAARAVGLANTAGLLQTVASEGPAVIELLERHAWMAPRSWLDRLRRVAPSRSGGSNSDPSLPGEHLTDRELDVLRMLASRLTLREIAEELFISVNTLKFHLKVIYRKLGVNSREEAAQLSRRMTRIGRQHQPSDAAPLPAPSARGR